MCDCAICSFEESIKVRPDDIKFCLNPEAPNKVESATLVGSTKERGFYVARFRLPPRERQPPHMHPDDRTYTVISGTMYSAVGTTFDPEKLIELPAGSFYTMPANLPHFSWTKAGQVVMQVTGNGPTGFIYCNPEDDPRNR